ncbi:MAG: WD40 repeat domain-containing protein [Pseudomonadota bacterium]|nr:WD40 repeat domain-containing protein [Pseudomonadota bacterium]
MTEPTNSLTQHVGPLEAGEHVIAAAFLGDAPALALANGVIKLGGRDVAAHPDAALLCAAFDGERLMTGGDDGRVVATGADGTTQTLGDEKGKWIDALAARDGAVAWSAGRTARARDAKGVVKGWTAPTSVRGLAFLPKGYRVAAAHYNGVSLWFPNADAAPQVMEWKGSHLDATVSPDGRFLVTTMQENALHGWRLGDGRNMRMTGYPGKTRSISWSHDGHWLATSGAEACVVWPFKEKDGPMGKPPRECGVRPHRVTQVAFHPRALVVAIGYADGMTLLSRLGDAAEILVRAPETGDGAISALAWDKTGARLLFGTEAGRAGLLTLPA